MKTFLHLSLLLIAVSAQSATFPAASGSRTHVLAAIALTSPGDTVTVPADSESWAGGITISGITLQGPGKDAGSPMTITTGTVTISKHATHNTKLIGFRFTSGSSKHFSLGGNSSNKPFIVGDCYFFFAGQSWGDCSVNGGLFYDCEWDSTTPDGADGFSMNLGGAGGSDGDDSWAAAQTMGTNDATGEVNTYFEDCTWTGYLEVAMDVDNGSRVVVRHCTFTDSSIVVHGGGSGSSSNDTSAYGGRHLEVYDCVFIRVSNAFAINKWVWMRGSSGVFANNVLDSPDSPDGFSYIDKPSLRFTVGCDTGSYPRDYQIGQSTQTPDATPDQPFLIVGNTGDGATGLNFVVVHEGISAGCADPDAFFQLGRDYVTSNTWSWTAFTYPHPLRSGAVVAPPTNLRITGRATIAGTATVR